MCRIKLNCKVIFFNTNVYRYTEIWNLTKKSVCFAILEMMTYNTNP